MIIIGNIGRAPESKTTKGGREYKVFSVAESWGKENDRTTNWFNISFYGDQAQLAGFERGVRVEITGDLKVNTKDGKVYLDLMSNRAKLAPLPKKEGAPAPAPAQTAGAAAPAAKPAAPQPNGLPDPYAEDGIPEDDIPF